MPKHKARAGVPALIKRTVGRGRRRAGGSVGHLVMVKPEKLAGNPRLAADFNLKPRGTRRNVHKQKIVNLLAGNHHRQGLAVKQSRGLRTVVDHELASNWLADPSLIQVASPALSPSSYTTYDH